MTKHKNVALDELRILAALMVLGVHTGQKVGLGDAAAVGAQGVTLANGGAVLGIQIDDLVYQRQLGILKLLFNVLLDLIGVLTHKTNIQHDSKSFPLFVILQMPEI